MSSTLKLVSALGMNRVQQDITFSNSTGTASLFTVTNCGGHIRTHIVRRERGDKLRKIHCDNYRKQGRTSTVFRA